MAEAQMNGRWQSDSPDMARIHIVGNLQLQNELFSQALAKATGLPCSCTSQENLPSVVGEGGGKKSVILWDCVDDGDEAIWNGLDHDLPKDDCQVILFNVVPGQNIETRAVMRGVKGIFYRGDSLSAYKKGIQTILRGQLWFSRMVLERCLTEAGGSSEDPAEKEVLLTYREQQILSMIASGLSKDDIADSLNISPHTVKTHTHNIYKKINVTSRVKATLWATRNLLGPNRNPAGQMAAIS